MKYLFIGLLLFASNSFAMRLTCTKKVSDFRTEITSVNSWPNIYVGTGYTECIDSNGVITCKMGVVNSIASEHSVCFENIDVKNDCSVKESGSFSSGLELDIQCNNGTSLVFIMGHDQLGKVTCMENSIPKNIWNLGRCKED